jgi:hypothetical protein
MPILLSAFFAALIIIGNSLPISVYIALLLSIPSLLDFVLNGVDFVFIFLFHGDHAYLCLLLGPYAAIFSSSTSFIVNSA